MGLPDRSRRLDSIDLLRGLVMVVMALDHVKGNFLKAHDFDALDLRGTSAAMFLTRWVTHFCAPTFVFLAGAGAFLYGARGRSKGQLAWFLVSRGLWLIVLELTVIRFAWVANLDYVSHAAFGQVIWVIGLSMIALAALVWLPVSAIAGLGVAMIAVHNSFDSVQAKSWGDLSAMWKILHTGETIQVTGPLKFAPFYPLVPWMGVLFAGYGFGALMLLEPARRRRELLGLGLALTIAFVALRYANVYGDKPAAGPGRPDPWSEQKEWLFTVFSFVNCQKYPPSLCFLLMTLGPAITAVALFEWVPERLGRPLVIFGRVPMFFYLLHWYLLKGLAILIAYLRYGHFEWLYGPPSPDKGPPEDSGFDLWGVYLLWFLVVALLYPLCWWYAGVKRRSKSVWLSYL